MRRRVLVPVVIAGCLAASAVQASDPVNPEALRRLVHQDCGSCHGLTLKGGLGPDLRAQNLQHHTPETLKSVILDGIVDTPMPPWRPLMTEAEAEWVARYLLNPEAE